MSAYDPFAAARARAIATLKKGDQWHDEYDALSVTKLAELARDISHTLQPPEGLGLNKPLSPSQKSFVQVLRKQPLLQDPGMTDEERTAYIALRDAATDDRITDWKVGDFKTYLAEAGSHVQATAQQIAALRACPKLDVDAKGDHALWEFVSAADASAMLDPRGAWAKRA
jgi:hypothetical protein